MIGSLKRKYSSVSAGVKASVAYFFANMLNKAIAYLTTPLYTNLMTSEEYGQVSLFLTWLSLIGIVAMFSFQAGVYNNGMMEFKEDRDNFSFSLLVLSNIITIVVGFIILAFYGQLKQILKMDIPLTLLMLICFILQPAYNYWITRQRFEYKYKMSTIVMIVMNIISPVVALILIKTGVLFGENKVYSRIFGAQGVFIAFYIVFYFRTIIKSNKRINFQYWKFAFLFNLPLIPHYLSQYMMSSSDKIMISYLLNDSQTAYYSVAYSVAAVVSIVWVSINGSLVPFSYQKCKEQKYADIAGIVYPLWIAFAVICILLMIFAPEIMIVLAPKEYDAGKYVIPPVIGGVFFQALYYTFANINYYYKKTKLVMYASLCAALVNVVLNYFMIPRFGFIAAGYTTLISYVIQALIDYFAMKTVVKEEIFNLKLVLCISGTVTASACLFPLLYNSFFLRYMLLALIIIMCFAFKNKLISFTKSLYIRMKGI